MEFDAIWDTGATASVITQAVVDACGLVATGMQNVQGVIGGPTKSETYLVNIMLPNNVLARDIHVTKGDFSSADIIIGMDIINQGDFAVTNLDGLTKFSFRFPSQVHIDFVDEARRTQLTEFQHGGTNKSRTKRPKPAKSKKR